MKYSTKQPSQNHNVSHDKPLREFFALLLGAALLFGAFLLIAGFLVDRAALYIDPALEARLFSNRFFDSREAPTEREAVLQTVLDGLAACIDVGYPVRLRIVESDDLNAFAYPGGSIVVLSALADTLNTKNGMAFVLAHELAHFRNRDHLRGMGRSLVFLAASVAVTGANSGLSSLLTPALGLEGAQFSQHRESDADATALHALNCFAGDVRDATEFFQLVQAVHGDIDWSTTHYFSSHPQVSDRIAAIERLAREFGYVLY
ncbi:MAG: M48 family metallopeptidase [Pseudomonadota bacterium]